MASKNKVQLLRFSESRKTREVSPSLTAMVDECITVRTVERREEGQLHLVDYHSHLIDVVDDAVCVEEFGFIPFCDPRIGIVSIRQMLGDKKLLYDNPNIREAYANRVPLSQEQRQEIFRKGVFY